MGLKAEFLHCHSAAPPHQATRRRVSAICFLQEFFFHVEVLPTRTSVRVLMLVTLPLFWSSRQQYISVLLLSLCQWITTYVWKGQEQPKESTTTSRLQNKVVTEGGGRVQNPQGKQSKQSTCLPICHFIATAAHGEGLKSLWCHSLCHGHAWSNTVRKRRFIVCLNHFFFPNNRERCQVAQMPAACKIELKQHQHINQKERAGVPEEPHLQNSAKTLKQSLQWER